MKIGLAQIKPSKGDIQANINTHKRWVELALSEGADFILFPELSLTAYEPTLAKDLALDKEDARLDVFQVISNQHNITIAIGLPLRSELGVCISMLIFQPNQTRKIYSKQKLHADEWPYFIEGEEQVILTIKGRKLAPAICYESLREEHAQQANALGADIYLASVAKAQGGVEKAFVHYPQIAKRYAMPVVMVNSLGPCDNFLSVGQSAVWNREGALLESLSPDKEGLLTFDTESGVVTRREV